MQTPAPDEFGIQDSIWISSSGSRSPHTAHCYLCSLIVIWRDLKLVFVGCNGQTKNVDAKCDTLTESNRVDLKVIMVMVIRTDHK